MSATLKSSNFIFNRNCNFSHLFSFSSMSEVLASRLGIVGATYASRVPFPSFSWNTWVLLSVTVIDYTAVGWKIIIMTTSAVFIVTWLCKCLHHEKETIHVFILVMQMTRFLFFSALLQYNSNTFLKAAVSVFSYIIALCLILKTFKRLYLKQNHKFYAGQLPAPN